MSENIGMTEQGKRQHTGGEGTPLTDLGHLQSNDGKGKPLSNTSATQRNTGESFDPTNAPNNEGKGGIAKSLGYSGDGPMKWTKEMVPSVERAEPNEHPMVTEIHDRYDNPNLHLNGPPSPRHQEAAMERQSRDAMSATTTNPEVERQANVFPDLDDSAAVKTSDANEQLRQELAEQFPQRNDNVALEDEYPAGGGGPNDPLTKAKNGEMKIKVPVDEDDAARLVRQVHKDDDEPSENEQQQQYEEMLENSAQREKTLKLLKKVRLALKEGRFGADLEPVIKATGAKTGEEAMAALAEWAERLSRESQNTGPIPAKKDNPQKPGSENPDGAPGFTDAMPPVRGEGPASSNIKGSPLTPEGCRGHEASATRFAGKPPSSTARVDWNRGGNDGHGRRSK